LGVRFACRGHVPGASGGSGRGSAETVCRKQYISYGSEPLAASAHVKKRTAGGEKLMFHSAVLF